MTKIKAYVLELTKRCNEACDFCYSISWDANTKRPRLKKQLNGSEWISALNNIIASGAQAVDFSGGEPTLHPQFNEIINHAKYLGLETIISTNGSTYENNTKRSGLLQTDYVALSLHGVGIVHDEIKERSGSYNQLLGAYTDLSKRSNGPKVKVNTVACQHNYNNIGEIGDTLNIENSSAQWKISQVALRESAKANAESVEISDEDFVKLKDSLKSRFPKAYSQDRLTFRDNDCTKKFVPYLIADSSGELQVPVGYEHIPIGANVTQINYWNSAEIALRGFEGFSSKVEKNHKAFYGK